jgi:hypothetical protein
MATLEAADKRLPLPIVCLHIWIRVDAATDPKHQPAAAVCMRAKRIGEAEYLFTLAINHAAVAGPTAIFHITAEITCLPQQKGCGTQICCTGT